jgi:hypothetical protein
MKVWLVTQPLTEFTSRWAEPRIARVDLVVLITVKSMLIT